VGAQRAPEEDRSVGLPGFRPGTTVRVHAGAIAFALVPRHLEVPSPAAALGVAS